MLRPTLMLASHRTVTLPGAESGARALYASHELLHKSFRVRVLRSERIAVDELLFYGDAQPDLRIAWTGPSLRPRLSVVLDGEAEIRVRGAPYRLGPGDVLLNRHLGDVCKRMTGETATMMTLDWDLGTLGTRAPDETTHGRLRQADLDGLRRAASSLCTSGNPSAVEDATMTELLARLRSFGAPIDAPERGAWNEARPDRAATIIAALDQALSTLSDQPMTVDLEAKIGVSRWQIQRCFDRVARHYALNGETWRTLRHRWRLGMAFFFTTAPGATTESVARAVGFGSPNALCRAFADAGLPSPGEVRRLAALRG